MFAGVTFILTFFQYESPRFLVKKGNPEKALENMAKIRHLPVDDPYVLREVNAIRNAYEEELEATMGSSWVGVIKELLFVPSNLYRLWLSVMVQILGQWSGAGSITLYAPDFFELLGITGDNESLLVSAVFGIVKLVAAICCALFLVDFIGRKRSLLIGITCQAVAMVYVASFLTAVPEIGHQEGYELPAAELKASRGAIAMIYLSGFGWALGMFLQPCPSFLTLPSCPSTISDAIHSLYTATSRLRINTNASHYRLEQHAILTDIGNLPAPHPRPSDVHRHDTALRQPVRQLARGAQHAAVRG